MKKNCLKLTSVSLFIILLLNYFLVPVYASSSSYDENSVTSENYSGDYNLTDFLEDVSFGTVEFTKFLMFVYSTSMGVWKGDDYTKLVSGCKNYFDSMGTGEWIHVDSNNNVTYDQKLIELLVQFLTEYSDTHPDEVEKLDYQMFRTLTYEEMWELNDINIPVNGVSSISPESLNTLNNFREIWSTQSEFKKFPSLLSPSVYTYMYDAAKRPAGGYINQNLTMYRGYETSLTDSNTTPVFVGSYNADGTYRISLYIYDYTEKALTLDRSQSMAQQYHVIPVNSGGAVVTESEDPSWLTVTGYKLESSGKWANSSGGNANIFCDYGYGGALGNIDMNYLSGYAEKLKAVLEPDYFTTTIPMLATPDGRSFKLFATQEDALTYMRSQKKPGTGGLNYDPNQVYTGGNVTITAGGDVIIGGGGSDFPETDNELLQAIYDRLGEILTQVKQIKWITLVDTVIDGLDFIFGDGGLANGIAALVDAVSQVFPLCILWDVVRLVEIFEAEPSPPVFTIPLKFETAGLDEEITLDLSEYDTIFAILRTGEIILFMVGLFNITMTWVGKGDEVI